MGSATQMVIDNPSKFGLLTVDLKKKMIEGGIATVNVMAALARRGAIKNINVQFITRNTFTERQIQFTPMPQGRYSLKAIQATVGATTKAPYMKRQEEGGQHKPVQGNTLAIPTDVARGGSKRRPVASSMRVSKLSKRRRVRSPNPTDYASRFRSKKARRVAMAYVAYKKKLFIPIGDDAGQRNLFTVTKFHKQKKSHHVAFRLKQVYKFDKSETKTEAEPWLLPASEKVAKQVQSIFNSQMKKLGM